MMRECSERVGERYQVIETGRLRVRGIRKFISERENLILRPIVAKICGKLPLLQMCSEIWHTVVESLLKNVKLLEEKSLQQILN